MRRALTRVAWLPLALVLAGCGEGAKQAQQAATKAQQAVTNTVETATTEVKEQLNLAGSSEMTLDVPLKTPSCYATFTPGAAGRPSTLALRSYRDTEKEEFPSFLIQATATSATSAAELAGQTLSAQMYVKPSADGATWHTAPAQTVELKISAVADKQLTAEVVGGELSRADGQRMHAAGKFVAVLP